MSPSSITALLQELENYCYTTAIVTFVTDGREPFVIDLKRREKKVSYGYEQHHKQLFIYRLGQCNLTGSIIIRSFTSEIDEFTQLPIKELRGYFLHIKAGNLQFTKISPTEMFVCQNTDVTSGEPLSLEQSLRYC